MSTDSDPTRSAELPTDVNREPNDERVADESPASPAVESLDEYIAIEKGDELPRRLLRHLASQDRLNFTTDEMQRALALLPDADPNLRRVRALVRAARQRYDGKYEPTVLDFARKSIAPILASTGFQDHTRPATARFQEIVASQTRGLHKKADARRSLNVILLALEILADAGLSMEDAVPLLRRALAEDREPEGRSNPRREGLAQLADLRITVDQLRRTLGLIEPWERIATQSRAAREASEREQLAAQSERDEALEQLAQRERAIQELEAALQLAREDAATLRHELRDAGSAGRGDVSAARARTLSFLKGRLRPTLETAREAGEVEPPNERVMRRMLLDALRDVDKEMEWLTSSA